MTQGEEGSQRLTVHASRDEKKTVLLSLSQPAEGEECGIGMEPIAEYRLEFFPEEHPGPHCVIAEAPQLTKATIVDCGHGFNALALLYHFAKNDMTCPFCRGGHSKLSMSTKSVPAHLRAVVEQQLELSRREARRNQNDDDSLDALVMLHNEVNLHTLSMVNRQVLILYAYVNEDSISPLLVQEIPLESSQSRGLLCFTSSTYSMRELTRNLRLCYAPLRSYELAVATRGAFSEATVLVRSLRFTLSTGTTVVPCVGGPFEDVALEVTTIPHAQHQRGFLELQRVALTVPPRLMHRMAQVNRGGDIGVYQSVLNE